MKINVTKHFLILIKKNLNLTCTKFRFLKVI